MTSKKTATLSFMLMFGLSASSLMAQTFYLDDFDGHRGRAIHGNSNSGSSGSSGASSGGYTDPSHDGSHSSGSFGDPSGSHGNGWKDIFSGDGPGHPPSGGGSGPTHSMPEPSAIPELCVVVAGLGFVALRHGKKAKA